MRLVGVAPPNRDTLATYPLPDADCLKMRATLDCDGARGHQTFMFTSGKVIVRGKKKGKDFRQGFSNCLI